MRKRSESGKLYPYVAAVTYKRKGGNKRKRGHLDMRVRRRDGPVCETCGRPHYPFQGCWTGPENQRRDWKGFHALSAELAAEMEPLLEQIMAECEAERLAHEQRAERFRLRDEEAARVHASVKSHLLSDAG